MQTNMLESGVNFKVDSHVESGDCFIYWIRYPKTLSHEMQLLYVVVSTCELSI